MSLLEIMMSMALTLALSGAAMSLLVAGHGIARTQPELGDLQQRARVALQAIGSDLRAAGTGMEHGPLRGSLARYFPAVTPSPDGRVTVWTVTSRDAQASSALAVAEGATILTLADAARCPTGEPACGFSPGTPAIAFTTTGCRTTLRVATVSSDTLQLAAPLAGCALDAGSPVAQGDVRTYRLDAAARQLVRRDEATGSSAPVLDGVVGFAAVFYADAAGTEVVAGTSDAELIRVRRVRVTLRLSPANPLLRMPDLTIAVDVAPANLVGS